MTLRLVTDTTTGGIYVGGYNIAPDVLLIRAESFESAWEVMCETFADAGSIVPANDVTDEERAAVYNDPEGCDWVDGHGLMVTADLVLRVVVPGLRD